MKPLSAGKCSQHGPVHCMVRGCIAEPVNGEGIDYSVAGGYSALTTDEQCTAPYEVPAGLAFLISITRFFHYSCCRGPRDIIDIC